MICSVCKFSGRRKKGCCSKCGTAVDSKGFRESDKVLATALLVELESHIAKRDRVRVYLSDVPKERRFAFDMISRCRAFLEMQDTKLDITFDDFIKLVIKEKVMKNEWYYQKLNSYLILKNDIIKFSQEVYRELREEKFQKELNKQRASVEVIDYVGSHYSIL